jgi:hypothetical protein
MSVENNQDESSHGGARKGAGRKAGAATQRTREIADAAASSGITPLEYLLSVMRDENTEQRERVAAAQSAAPYIHPKLSSIEHSGPNGAPIPVATSFGLIPLTA